MAIVVKDYVVQNKLYTPIAGKNYVNVEGWQFAGGLLGLFPRVVKVESLAENKWLAQVDIVNKNNNSVASTGFAICSKEESKKRSFDEYAILSMAQTRAIGKAYRNLIGWIMKLAGYEATPAEEIKTDHSQPNSKPNNSQDKVNELKGMLKGNTDIEKLADLKKRTSITPKGFTHMSEKQASLIIYQLLAVKK